VLVEIAVGVGVEVEVEVAMYQRPVAQRSRQRR
jgi:hypothetical protein